VDISKAKKVVELEKDGRKILVTLWEGNQISSCVTGEDNKSQYCETCQCDDETCQEWLEHLKSHGYQATEIELGELELEESLPKFLEQRQVVTSEDVGRVEEILGEPEGDEHAISGTPEDIPGSDKPPSEGE